MNTDPSDQIPQCSDAEIARLAQQDQDEAGRRAFAGLLYTHMLHLIAAGFTEQQAIWLTAQFQNAVLVYRSGGP